MFIAIKYSTYKTLPYRLPRREKHVSAKRDTGVLCCYLTTDELVNGIRW